MPNPKVSINFYGVDEFCLDESFVHTMKQVLVSVYRQTNARMSSCRLTNAQQGLLMHLKITGRSTVKEIARSINVDPGATTRLVDRLERSGYCTRTRSHADRRMVIVTITRKGELELSNVPANLCLVLNEHLNGFSEVELSAFKTYLLRIMENGWALRSR